MNHAQLFGVMIREARATLGMSQAALAEALGVTRAAVSLWETGQAEPQAANMLALRELLGPALLEPSPPLAADELAYWRGRVEQIAAHMALVLDEQRKLAADMRDHAGGKDAEAEALAARARATMLAHAAQVAAAPPAAAATPAPRRRKAR